MKFTFALVCALALMVSTAQASWMMNAYLIFLDEPNYDNFVAIGLTQMYAWLAPMVYGYAYVFADTEWNGTNCYETRWYAYTAIDITMDTLAEFTEYLMDYSYQTFLELLGVPNSL